MLRVRLRLAWPVEGEGSKGVRNGAARHEVLTHREKQLLQATRDHKVLAEARKEGNVVSVLLCHFAGEFEFKVPQVSSVLRHSKISEIGDFQRFLGHCYQVLALR